MTLKKIILSFLLLLTTAVGASAMSYSQARDQALFLTDKMAYELNLTEEQYEAAYEINLDYLMSIDSSEDLFGAYWEQRNLDLSYILFSWQYNAYLAASYFYRPLYWEGGFWHFAIYGRYPHRDYFFFGRPVFYTTYHGGHSWHHNGGRSYWASHRVIAPHGDHRPHGMRDRFDKGSFGNGTRLASNASRSFGNGTRLGNTQPGNNRPNRKTSAINGTRTFGNGQKIGKRTDSMDKKPVNTTRPSSTRTTVTRPSTAKKYNFGSRSTTNLNRTFKPSQNTPSRSMTTPRRSFNLPTSSRSIDAKAIKSRSTSGNSVRKATGGPKASGHFSPKGHAQGRK